VTLFTNELRFELGTVDKKIRMGQIMAVSNRKFSILILLVIVISPSLLPTLGFTSMHLVLKDKQNLSGTQVGEWWHLQVPECGRKGRGKITHNDYKSFCSPLLGRNLSTATLEPFPSLI